MKTPNLRRTRLLWVAMQGAFLPLVYFAGELNSSLAKFALLIIYTVLVYVDATLTCKIFEPRDKP